MHLPGDSLLPEFKKRTTMDFEQPVGDKDSEIRSMPIRWASNAAWWSFVNGKPFETIGCPNCSSASMTM
jgi:hypothetical protein